MAQGDVTDSTPEGYVWQPYSCRYDIMSTPDRLACMRERNITRFLDYGDRLVNMCIKSHVEMEFATMCKPLASSLNALQHR